MKHTQGPWYAKNSAGNYQGLVIAEDSGATIAVTYDVKDMHLVAAAPELLEALRQIEAQLSTHPEAEEGNSKVHFAMHKARTAIAKAKGEA
jgi:hypothetical protein